MVIVLLLRSAEKSHLFKDLLNVDMSSFAFRSSQEDPEKTAFLKALRRF